ncbi:MAG: hypothetical protein ACOYM3_10485 [Terrimicrobiaceae bacterium]
MKTTALCSLALGGFLLMTACVTVKKEPVTHTTTTTSEQTTLTRPGAGTVETRTLRSY